MSLDLDNVKPFFRISSEEASKEVSCHWGEARQDVDVLLGDLLHDLVARLIHLDGLLEGIQPTDHFVKKHAETPPVDAECVAHVLDNLWGEVLGCTTESIRKTCLWLLDFRKAKVSQLDMPFVVDKHIFGFEIAIDDAIRMQVRERQNHFCGIKPCPIFRKSDLVAQVEEQFTSVEEVCDEVQTLI